MNDVEEQMQALVHAIENSDVYTAYVEQKNKVMEHPEVRDRINEYRSRNYRLQHTEGIDLFYELEALENEYRDFLNEEMVQKYLDRELAVCRLMQKVSRELVAAIDLDLDEVTL